MFDLRHRGAYMAVHKSLQRVLCNMTESQHVSVPDAWLEVRARSALGRCSDRGR